MLNVEPHGHVVRFAQNDPDCSRLRSPRHLPSRPQHISVSIACYDHLLRNTTVQLRNWWSTTAHSYSGGYVLLGKASQAPASSDRIAYACSGLAPPPAPIWLPRPDRMPECGCTVCVTPSSVGQLLGVAEWACGRTCLYWQVQL